MAVALWNGKDPILKERMFGLSNREGNHGEDVKELYYYLDAVPTYSYVPHALQISAGGISLRPLVQENARRDRTQPEFEIIDTGIFDDDRYFDVDIEYAKAGADDILLRLTVTNRGPEEAAIHVLPQVWFRNTWSWFTDGAKPSLERPRRTMSWSSTRHSAPMRSTSRAGRDQVLRERDQCRKTVRSRRAGRLYKDGFHEYWSAGQGRGRFTQRAPRRPASTGEHRRRAPARPSASG